MSERQLEYLYHDLVTRRCRSKVYDRQAASDISQEVFNTVFQWIKKNRLVDPDLRLIAWGNGSGVPTDGKNLIVVGVDDSGLLRVRAFGAGGDLVVDTDETKLPGPQAVAALSLKRQLPRLLHPHVLTVAERAQFLAESAQILGQSRLGCVPPRPGRDGTRRSWFRPLLFGILRNKIGDHIRDSRKHPPAVGGTAHCAAIEQIPEESTGDSDELDVSEEKMLCLRALELAKLEFKPATFDMAWRRLALGQSTADIANDLKVTTNSVFIACSRLRKRVREILASLDELLDDPDDGDEPPDGEP